MAVSEASFERELDTYPPLMTQKAPVITFGGDGTFDLLTNAYTPRFFYAHLDREIALANRAEAQGRIYPISLIAFRLPPPVELSIRPISKKKMPTSNHSAELVVSSYEKSLIHISRTIEKAMREGDLLARIYESGFVISTRNTDEGATAMKERMKELIPPDVRVLTVVRNTGDSRVNLISRLDHNYFMK